MYHTLISFMSNHAKPCTKNERKTLLYSNTFAQTFSSNIEEDDWPDLLKVASAAPVLLCIIKYGRVLWAILRHLRMMKR